METTVIIRNDGFLGLWASLVTQMVKICLQCRRPRLSLGWDDPLEKGMLLQYSCLENSMDREACIGYSPWGNK